MSNNQVHYLCATCLNEIRSGKVKANFFSSLLPLRVDSGAKDEYCCKCGQQSYVAAIFIQAGDYPCDGEHVDVVYNDE